MIKLLLAALLAPAGAAYALDEVSTATAPVAAAAAETRSAPAKYAPEIMRTMKNLSALLEHGAEIPPARLDALAPELKTFNGKIEDALGREIVTDMARREKEQDDRERAAAAKLALQDLRTALQGWYADNGGKYPADPAALAPGKIPAIPELCLPGHKKTAAIRVIDSKKYDKDLAGAVNDDGGWLYFSDPDSASYGLLIINCRHAETGGQEFFKY